MTTQKNGRKHGGVARFRAKLLIAMMVVVVVLTSLGLFLAQRKVAIEAERDFLQDFRNELATLHGVQEVRHAALAERCHTLVMRPRIHAALEDNALDLLYPSAQDELRDITDPSDDEQPEGPGHALNARFYRFLDSHGAVITPPPNTNVGPLAPAEEAQLTLPSVPTEPQIGYLLHDDGQGCTELNEIIAMPIISSQTGEVLAALVLGFRPVEFRRNRTATEIKNGIWLEGRLHIPALPKRQLLALNADLSHSLIEPLSSGESLEVKLGSEPHLVFYKELNPGSLFPLAYEVAVYPLANAIARQHQIRRHVILAGSLLFLGGLLASYLLSRHLSEPVEELAVTSEENRAKRQSAEAALVSTSQELQRAARFSSDASHQLKTPVTVLRAGVEELLAREDFSPEIYHELSALLHQTYRMTGMVDDLLLLSRMDAGRLQIRFETVNLSKLLEEWIDDLSAMPDELHVKLKTNFPPDLEVRGERRYLALIVQNLLENARKYNKPGGEICVAVREEDDFVILTVENTGAPIPPAAREHIFERFHRGAVGENVPGHGLGLNLARELARLHEGDLRLVRSDAEWTEFEVRFRSARHPGGEAALSS